MYSTTPVGHSFWRPFYPSSNAVGLFYTSSWLGHWTLVGEAVLHFWRCSRRSLHIQLTGPLETRCGGRLTLLQMQLMYSIHSADWATGHSLWRPPYPSADAVGVFYTSSWLGHWTHVVEAVLPFCRCSRCILHIQLIGPLDTRCGGRLTLLQMTCILYIQLTEPLNTRCGGRLTLLRMYSVYWNKIWFTFRFYSYINIYIFWDCVHKSTEFGEDQIHYCYGEISYHTPKIDSYSLNIFSELAHSGKTTSRFLRDICQTDCKPRTASTSFIRLPFSANSIAFTYHPLFELFFHRSYLKTTTIT